MDKALHQAIFNLLADHTDLYQRFTDSPTFQRWLADATFTTTYRPPTD